MKRRRKHSSQRKKGHRQDLTILKVLDIKSDQKINGDSSFEILGKVSKEQKKITTKAKVVSKELEKSDIKSKENVSSSSSVKKNQKKSASTNQKPKNSVDKKTLQNKANKEKLDNKSK